MFNNDCHRVTTQLQLINTIIIIIIIIIIKWNLLAKTEITKCSKYCQGSSQ